MLIEPNVIFIYTHQKKQFHQAIGYPLNIRYWRASCKGGASPISVNPIRIKLELTERVVMNEVSDMVTKMHALKALGVRLSLDDCGAVKLAAACLPGRS
jgi:hypothetical protein